MADKPIARVPFQRGPERRKQDTDISADGRRSDNERRRNDLSWATLFRGVENQALEEVFADCEVLVLAPGTPLLRPGQANDSVFVLLSGELSTHIDSSLGSETGILIHAGESVGEMSAIDGKPVSALVLAASEARVLRLPPDIFWNHISAFPSVARNLLAALTERMRRSNESMLEAQRKRLALEYLQQELEVARQLQVSMLPAKGPMFPRRDDIEIEGTMEAASAIGGDLFDAFLVDAKTLFLCIGDVSGHGIPAALFMARTIGLMRIIAMTTSEPHQLLERLNDQLSAGNEANIFVTLFCAILDLHSGRLTYSNGGHLPPLLLSQADVKELPLPKGALVGAIQGLRYSALETRLEPGTALLCYTDGVTEAADANDSEFGEARLHQLAAASLDIPVSALLERVRGEVMRFAAGKPLADDCTMLALRRPPLP